jgi:uncharacterized membrane protein YidH (DUF202 family)
MVRMDPTQFLLESVVFTRNTLIRSKRRSLILILLALPGALLLVMTDPEYKIYWQMLPGGAQAFLIVAAIIGAVFIAGYCTRIARGTSDPVEFDHWREMFSEGIKSGIVFLIWLVPILALIVMMLGINYIVSATWGPDSDAIKNLGGSNLILIILLYILIIVTILMIPMGMIRFAKTDRIREGIRFQEVQDFIKKNGWGDYLLSYIVLMIICLICYNIIGVLSYIHYIGPIIFICGIPPLIVFAVRYMTSVYEAGGTRIMENNPPEQ